MVRLQVSLLCDPVSNPIVDAVRWLSLLLILFFILKGFSLGTPVFPCPHNQHFPIPIRPGTLCAWVNKLQFFIVETRVLTLRRSSHCSLDLPEHRIAQMRPMVLTIKSKIPLLSAKNQMVQALFRKFYSKISVYLISRVRNGKSENCVPFDHFSFFQYSASTSYKSYVCRLDKKNRKTV